MTYRANDSTFEQGVVVGTYAKDERDFKLMMSLERKSPTFISRSRGVNSNSTSALVLAPGFYEYELHEKRNPAAK